MDALPESLREEAKQVEDDIRRAFKGVSRAGGISWSGARVLDDYGEPWEVEAAAAQDTEESWEELVDDETWTEEVGLGGFCFLDAIGFRYYIAAAMIRSARRGYGEHVGSALGNLHEQMSAITPPQARAIARFVCFMIKTHATEGDEIGRKYWEAVYDRYWRRF
jgi:hypothetical protein